MVFLCGGCGGKKKKSNKNKKDKTNGSRQNSVSKAPLISAPIKSNNGNYDSVMIITTPPGGTLRIRTTDFPSAPLNNNMGSSRVQSAKIVPPPPTAEKPVDKNVDKPHPSKSIERVSSTLAENREMVKRALDISPEEADFKRKSHMIKNPYELQQQEAAFATMAKGEQPKMQSFFPALENNDGEIKEQFNIELEQMFKQRLTPASERRKKEEARPMPVCLMPIPASFTTSVPLPPSLVGAPPAPAVVPTPVAVAKTMVSVATPAPPPLTPAPTSAHNESVQNTPKIPTAPALPSVGAGSTRSKMGMTVAKQQMRTGAVDKPVQRASTPQPARPSPDMAKTNNRNVVSSYRTGTLTRKWACDYNQHGTIKTIREKKREQRKDVTSIEEFNRELEVKLRKRNIYIENSARAKMQ